jgi:hypothetical protein
MIFVFEKSFYSKYAYVVGSSFANISPNKGTFERTHTAYK